MEKNRLMMIIIIVLLLVLLGTIVFVSVFAFRTISSLPTESGNQQIVSQEAAVLSREQITAVPAGDPMIINTNLAQGADGSSKHAIKVDLHISVNNNVNGAKKAQEESADFIERLTADVPFIKATVLKVLRSKTYEEVSRADSIDVLNDEITRVLQEEYLSNLIVGAVISDMDIQ